MLENIFNLIKPWLFKCDPEQAHDFAIKSLKYLEPLFPKRNLQNGIDKNGFMIPSRLGLAAGFDKNAQAVNALLKAGFGFVEIGTVTPKPQQGNPKPRLFRLEQDQAIINRMGFNNEGAEIISRRLKDIRIKGQNGVIGVNIGANKDTENKIDDYAECAKYFLDVASYFTVNVSSPNTAGLRDLQNKQALSELLSKVIEVAHKYKPIPIFLKISPDQQEYNLSEIIEVVNTLPLCGLIASNTTMSRDNLISQQASETGGLSGKPLLEKANELLVDIKKALNPEKVLIGVGGIMSYDDALEKINLGADAIQIYSGFIYKGLSLVNQINTEINKRGFC